MCPLARIGATERIASRSIWQSSALVCSCLRPCLPECDEWIRVSKWEQPSAPNFNSNLVLHLAWGHCGTAQLPRARFLQVIDEDKKIIRSYTFQANDFHLRAFLLCGRAKIKRARGEWVATSSMRDRSTGERRPQRVFDSLRNRLASHIGEHTLR
jgi:hypothetical protein